MSSDNVGIGYTLATGKLFCRFSDFQDWASNLTGRSLMTHEFADPALWDELRERFEQFAKSVAGEAG